MEELKHTELLTEEEESYFDQHFLQNRRRFVKSKLELEELEEEPEKVDVLTVAGVGVALGSILYFFAINGFFSGISFLGAFGTISLIITLIMAGFGGIISLGRFRKPGKLLRMLYKFDLMSFFKRDRTKTVTYKQKPRKKTRGLFRSKKNKKIAGVASGIAKYFGLSPAVIRLLFLVFLPFTSLGVIIIYVLLSLVLEEGDE